jgi:hypothetical protein
MNDVYLANKHVLYLNFHLIILLHKLNNEDVAHTYNKSHQCPYVHRNSSNVHLNP